MDESLRRAAVACIGAGYWGKNLVRNFQALGRLASVCESDRSRWSELSAAYPSVRLTDSIEQVLADPEINGVAIATPAETHADIVQRALLAGKDVFVEKPLCLSVEEGEKLVALAAGTGRILMIGHLLWYHPAVLKLKQLVDEGELGRIRYIYSNRLNLGKIRREENILWSFAPHDISVILGLLGEMPHTVTAQGGNYLNDQIADVTVSLLSFPSGTRAHVFVSWLHPFKEQKLVVVGDKKMAVFDDLGDNKLLLYPHEITWKQHMPVAKRAQAEAVPVDDTEPLRQECLHFLTCIETRETPRTDGAEGLRVLSVLQQCQNALQKPATGDRRTQPPRSVAVSSPVAHTSAASAQPVIDRKAVTTPAASAVPTRDYFAHESVAIDEDVEIGSGTSIWHVSHILKNSRIGRNCRIGQNVVIGPRVTIGDGVKIQNNVSVYEGVTLEDHVFCGPSMVFTNVMNPRSEIQRMGELRRTLVREGATLGANCTIVCGVTIGSYAFVGAGAVILDDVPDFALMVGNPARIIGAMCACGHRITFESGEETGLCKTCGQQYRKTGTTIARL